MAKIMTDALDSTRRWLKRPGPPSAAFTPMDFPSQGLVFEVLLSVVFVSVIFESMVVVSMILESVPKIVKNPEGLLFLHFLYFM